MRTLEQWAQGWAMAEQRQISTRNALADKVQDALNLLAAKGYHAGGDIVDGLIEVRDSILRGRV